MESDFLVRLQLAEEALAKAKLSLEATRLDCNKQKKRLADLRKEAETVALARGRGDVAKSALKQIRTIEEEPNLSFSRRAETVRKLVLPLAGWSPEAKALLTLIDLELKHIA